MDEKKIYEFQLKDIHNTLRLVANLHDSRKKTTSMDRDIMQSMAFVENALNNNPDIHVSRM